MTTYCLSPSPLIRLAGGLRDGEFRPGLVAGKTFTGEQQARDHTDVSLRRCKVRLIEFGNGGDQLLAWQNLLRQTAHMVEPMWIRFDGTYNYPPIYCGPVGDGSRTVFPVHLAGTGYDVLAAGALMGASDFNEAAANLLSGSQASPEDETVSGVTGLSATVTRMPGMALFGCASFRVTPSGSVANAGVKDSESIPVVADRSYRAVSAVQGLGTFETAIDWFESDESPISTSDGSGVSGAWGEWTTAEVVATAPAAAAYAKTKTRRTSTSNAPFLVDCRGLLSFGLDYWSHPGLGMRALSLDSAPATGKRVAVVGAGEAIVRGKLQVDAVYWDRLFAGYDIPQDFEFVEELDRG